MQNICEEVLDNEVRLRRPKKGFIEIYSWPADQNAIYTLAKRKNKAIDKFLRLKQPVWDD